MAGGNLLKITTRFGKLTAINNTGSRVDGEEEKKTAFDESVPTTFV